MSCDKSIKEAGHKSFENIKRGNDQGQEFWLARELQNVLDYSSWDKFERVLQRAIIACRNSKQPEEDHFSQVEKMVQLGSGAERKTKGYKLSHYTYPE